MNRKLKRGKKEMNSSNVGDGNSSRPGGSSSGSFASLPTAKMEIKQFLEEYFGFEVEEVLKAKKSLNRLRSLNDIIEGKPFFWKLLELANGEKTLKLLVDLVVSHGANVNAKNEQGMNFLHYAVKASRFEKEDDNFNIFERVEKRETRWNATKLKTSLMTLKVAGADPTAEDIEGDDVLKYALFRGATYDIINFLLIHICPPSVLQTKNGKGDLPLRLAISSRKITDDTILLLIKKGANIFSVDSQGNTMVHDIIDHRRPLTEKMKKLIIDHANFMKNSMNHRNIFPLLKLLTPSGSTFESIVIADDIFNALIPKTEIINSKELVCSDDNEPGMSVLGRLVAFPYIGEEREERIKKLVDAGAEITGDVLKEGIKQGTKIVNILLALKAEPEVFHLRTCLESENHDGIQLLKIILPNIKNGKEIIKKEFPDIVLQCLRYMRFKNTEQMDLEVINLLLDEYNVDVNFTREGDVSLLHWLSYMQHGDEERAIFLKELIKKYGAKLNLDIKCPRDGQVEWIDNDRPPVVVPLQIALENRNFVLSQVLIRSFASIEEIDWTTLFLKPNVLVGKDDTNLYVVLRMLNILEVDNPHVKAILVHLKDKHKNFKALQEEEELAKTDVPSLLELSCLNIRNNWDSQSIQVFIDGCDLGPKVKEFIFLEHIKPITFPPRIPMLGANDSDDDYLLDDDDDNDYDGSDFFDSDHNEYGVEYYSDLDDGYNFWFD